MIGILLTHTCILPYNYEIVCEGRSISIEAVKVDFQDYVPLKSVADLIGANYIYDNNTQRLYLTMQNRQVEIIGNVPVIRQNAVFKNIPFAPLYIAGDIYFPVSEIIPTIGASFEKLMFIKEIKEAPLIDKIELVEKGDSTILRFNWPRTIDSPVSVPTTSRPRPPSAWNELTSTVTPGVGASGTTGSAVLAIWSTYPPDDPSVPAALR